MSDRYYLNGLNPNIYEHEWDRNAKAALDLVPFMGYAIKTYNKYISDNITSMLHYSSYLEINDKQYPSLYKVFKDCCKIMDLPVLPLFLERNHEINAYTCCTNSPLVCMTSGCIADLTEEELRFIIGHELGHVKSSHVMYKEIADFLIQGGSQYICNSFPVVGPAAAIAIEAAFYKWNRMSEFTADRAGLLCCQDINASLSASAKLAGFTEGLADDFSTEEFLNQAYRFEQKYDEGFNGIVTNAFMAFTSKTHPLTVKRTLELQKWFSSGEYERVLNMFKGQNLLNNSYTPEINGFRTCPNCGYNRIPLDGKFCPECGSKLI